MIPNNKPTDATVETLLLGTMLAWVAFVNLGGVTVSPLGRKSDTDLACRLTASETVFVLLELRIHD